MVVPPEDDEQDSLPGLMVGVVKTWFTPLK